MGRPPRIREPGLAYHVLNRRVMRLPPFLKDDHGRPPRLIAADPTPNRPPPTQKQLCTLPGRTPLALRAGSRPPATNLARSAAFPKPTAQVACCIVGGTPWRGRRRETAPTPDTGSWSRKGVRKIFLISPAVRVESGHGAAATHHGSGSCASRPESACDASASVFQRRPRTPPPTDRR